MGILTHINNAISDLSLSSSVITFGTDSEQNIYADDVASGGTFIGIYPYSVEVEKPHKIFNTYSVNIFWGKLATFDQAMTAREGELANLETLAKKFIYKLEARVRAAGELQGALDTFSINANRFNSTDANLDGVFLSFQLKTQENIDGC